MKKENIQEKLLSKSKNSQLEKFGKTITFFCIAVIVFVVAMIFFFVAQKGFSTFFCRQNQSFQIPVWDDLESIRAWS